MSLRRQETINSILRTWTVDNNSLLKTVLNEMAQSNQEEERFWATSLDYELLEIANAIIEAD